MAREKRRYTIRLRRKTRGEGGDEEGLDPLAWMVTFSDLLTLLLTFFVMLLVMSSMDVKKLKKMFGFFTGAIGVMGSNSKGIIDSSKIVFPMPKNVDPEYFSKILSMAQEIEGEMEGRESIVKLNDISVVSKAGKIVVTFYNKILFDEGKADIKPEMLPVLIEMGEWVKGSDYLMRVEGHTDNVPINTVEFPSNWELSTARAVNILRFLLKSSNISPSRLSALGFGEHRSLFPNDTPEHRSKNRRVEIILEKKEKGGI